MIFWHWHQLEGNPNNVEVHGALDPPTYTTKRMGFNDDWFPLKCVSFLIAAL